MIAYGQLPGTPVLTLDDDSKPVWYFDREDPRYARAPGQLIAELHGNDPATVRAAGIPVESPAEVRDVWRSRLKRVAAAFTIATELADQWAWWLADDDLWPDDPRGASSSAVADTSGRNVPLRLLVRSHG